MKKSSTKARCIKQSLSKSIEVVKTYDKIQTAYALKLQEDKNIVSFQCNVPLRDVENGNYTTDFVCKKTDGNFMVRECVFRTKITLPRTVKLLDESMRYWTQRGISDWGIVTEREEARDEE